MRILLRDRLWTAMSSILALHLSRELKFRLCWKICWKAHIINSIHLRVNVIFTVNLRTFLVFVYVRIWYRFRMDQHTHTDKDTQLHEALLRVVNAASVSCFFTFSSVVSAVMCFNSSGSRRNDLLCTVIAASVCGAKSFCWRIPKSARFLLYTYYWWHSFSRFYFCYHSWFYSSFHSLTLNPSHIQSLPRSHSLNLPLIPTLCFTELRATVTASMTIMPKHIICVQKNPNKLPYTAHHFWSSGEV